MHFRYYTRLRPFIGAISSKIYCRRAQMASTLYSPIRATRRLPIKSMDQMQRFLGEGTSTKLPLTGTGSKVISLSWVATSFDGGK